MATVLNGGIGPVDPHIPTKKRTRKYPSAHLYSASVLGYLAYQLNSIPFKQSTPDVDLEFTRRAIAMNPIVFFRMNQVGVQTSIINPAHTLTPNDSLRLRTGKPSMSDDNGGAAKFSRDHATRFVGNAALNTATDFERTDSFSIVANVTHDFDTTWAAATNGVIVSKALGETPFTGYEFSIRRYATNGPWYIRIEMTGPGGAGGGMNVYGTSISVPNTQISSIGFSYTGLGTTGSITTYVNGVAVGTRTPTGSLTSGTMKNSAEFKIGGRGQEGLANINPYQGWTGDVLVFNRALSAQEFADLAERRKTYTYRDAYENFFANPTQPVRVIFDDDCDSDIDGVSNIAAVSAMDKNGLINLLGSVVTSKFDNAVAASDILFKYAATTLSNSKLSTLRTGAWQGTTGDTNIDNWMLQTVDAFRASPALMRVRTEFEDSLITYRTLLAAAPNNSVVIVIGGTWHSVLALRDSPADGISGLTGWELMKQKVQYISFCGTQDTNANENNMRFGIAEGRAMFRACPVPIVSAPVEQFLTPTVRVKSASTSDLVNPFKYAYAAWHVNQSLSPSASRGIGDIMPAIYAAKGRQDGLFKIDKWQHTLTFRDNGSVASRTPYPGDDYGLITKQASDTVIGTYVQSLIDQTAGT